MIRSKKYDFWNASMLNRAFINLGDADVAKAAIEAVERLFNKHWLEAAEGKHRLQMLWKRLDGLATSELYCLGRAIVLLSGSNSEWLAKTAKTIRGDTSGNNPGRITEILTCAFLSVPGGTLTPAPDAQPGFDAVATLGSGVKHFISIKSHDVSKAEKEFRQRCRRIRRAFRERLAHDRQSMALNIVSTQEFDEKTADSVFAFIRSGKAIPGSYQLNDGAVRIILTQTLSSYGELSGYHISDQVLVVAPQGLAEQQRFLGNIRKAALNMKQNISGPADSKNILMMRLHSSADIAWLSQAAESLLNEEEAPGVDMIALFQPSVVRKNDNSLILHTVSMRLNHRIIEDMNGSPLYHYEFPVGQVTDRPSRLNLQGEFKEPIGVPDHMYMFQEGDVFVLGRNDGSGGQMLESSNPAPGIHVHGVLTMLDQVMSVAGRFPRNEDLMIL